MEFSELVRDFLDDAAAHLKAFDTGLLSLEKNGCSRDVVLSLLGSLHTLKGNSGMMGFESLKRYIHLVEEVFKRVNDGDMELAGVMDALFECANVVRNALRAIEKDPAAAADLTAEILSIEEQLEGTAGRTEKQAVDPEAYLGTKTDTIKVDFRRLDELLNLVGELVIFKTRLNQIEAGLRASAAGKALVKDLSSSLELMGKTISGLQEGIMRARMLPVGHVFAKFPRMVRDIAKAQGKDICLLFEGEETELDKTVIDELEKPLLHIIRNSVDHGIETREERAGKGKAPRGTIVLSAAQESNYVIIKVKDDGRGINLDRVKEKAAERGLIRPDEQLDKESLLSLIFTPGFTTKSEATDISGRGIGLDAASRGIAGLNGQVIIDTLPQQGTELTIKLPLSLAIIPALMAEACGEVYAIPMSSVDESIKVGEEEIHVINDHEVVRFRERVLPVVRLSDFLGLEGGRQKRFYLVILGRADKRIAVAVDRLRGQQEVVIKPLDDTFGKSRGIAGASILGDGRIVLIIDVMAFWAEEAGRPGQK